MRRILVVDDERSTREALVDILAAQGYEVDAAAEGGQAREFLADHEYDLVLSDLVVPGVTGLEILEQALARDPLQKVIMVTGYGTVETAVEAMQRGAFHYLTKPVKPLELKNLVARAMEDRRLREENAALQRRLEEVDGFAGMIGDSGPWARVKTLVQRVAPTGTTVLIQGESGTGKELVAGALHDLSRRSGRPLVKVNCAALVESLLQSELFGHVKGAFTGALQNKRGRFERADGGTLFLDEIGEMSPETQARLLRVLQDGEVEPVGSEESRKVDVRVVAATNRNLEEAIAEGRFREDLYYRLKVVRIELPPLRQRPEDIPVLVRHFLGVFDEKYDLGVNSVDVEAMERLRAYPWPGNVRELRNCIEGAMVTCAGDRLRLEDLPREVRGGGEVGPDSVPAGLTIDELERRAIVQALDHTEGNRTAAAERLGISLRTLQRKLKQYRSEGLLPDVEG